MGNAPIIALAVMARQNMGKIAITLAVVALGVSGFALGRASAAVGRASAAASSPSLHETCDLLGGIWVADMPEDLRSAISGKSFSGKSSDCVLPYASFPEVVSPPAFDIAPIGAQRVEPPLGCSGKPAVWDQFGGGLSC